jgi:flavin reductase (DIM6/NTAB) family NADH-FMN oxidoreductase RutF
MCGEWPWYGPGKSGGRMTKHAAHQAESQGDRAVVTPVVIEPRELRRALAGFPTGVTVVTACNVAGQIAGVTVNSFCSVSLAPPLLLWCLSKNAPSSRVFTDASHFAIHVLAANQKHLSKRFSSPSIDKFAELQFDAGLGRAPILGGAVATFECRLTQQHDGGDHLILIGEVERYNYSDRHPLLFHAGDYDIPAKSL